MQNQPVKHHYVPRFYLAGFTLASNDKSRLFVFNTEYGKTWPSTPKKSAFQNHYYSIDTKDKSDPTVIEKTLGTIEGRCSVAIRNILQSKSLADNESLQLAVNFVALMNVRVPAVRDSLKNFWQIIAENIASHRIQSLQTKNNISNEANDGLNEKNLDPINSGKITVEIEEDQNWQISTMLQSGAQIVPALMERNWGLWIAADDAPDFVCSDRPVSVNWVDGEGKILPPGLAYKNTIVMMPLNRRVTLVGTHEELQQSTILDRHDVSVVNAATISGAIEIYSAERDFVYAISDTECGTADIFFDAFKSKENNPK